MLGVNWKKLLLQYLGNGKDLLSCPAITISPHVHRGIHQWPILQVLHHDSALASLRISDKCMQLVGLKSLESSKITPWPMPSTVIYLYHRMPHAQHGGMSGDEIVWGSSRSRDNRDKGWCDSYNSLRVIQCGSFKILSASDPLFSHCLST